MCVKIGFGEMKFIGVAILILVSFQSAEGDTDNPYLKLIDSIILFKPKKQIQCMSSCRGMPDGDYPSCMGCLYFATCTNGYLVDSRKCAWFGGLFWDDNAKRCEWTSSTCNLVIYERPRDDQITMNLQARQHASNHGCVNNCYGVQNGDYQSCYGCRVFVTCSNGLTYDRRPCPWFLLWDDYRKRCEWRSRTCTKYFPHEYRDIHENFENYFF